MLPEAGEKKKRSREHFLTYFLGKASELHFAEFYVLSETKVGIQAVIREIEVELIFGISPCFKYFISRVYSGDLGFSLNR